MPRLAEAITQEANIYVRSAIWLYLLTGVRKTELLTAKWEDINFVRSELRLADTKAGRIHYVHLSLPAIDFLNLLPRMAGNASSNQNHNHAVTSTVCFNHTVVCYNHTHDRS